MTDVMTVTTLPTLELDGIPILFETAATEAEYEAWPGHLARIRELGDRITYGRWPADDFPLRGHMLILSLAKLVEADLPKHHWAGLR